jgi:hypothetical protein
MALRWEAADVLRSGGVDPARWLPALETSLTGSKVPQISWEKVSRQQALTDEDRTLLYELVRKRADRQGAIRGVMFDSIFQILERRPTASSS